MPRTEIATSRAAISKIQKDFERIKSIMVTTSNEVSLLRPTNDSDPSRPGSNNIKNSNTDTNFNGLVVSEPLSSNTNQYNPPQQLQKLALKPLMQEHDVDQMIIEERERDIRKVNHDLALVNEMFKDMAEIVERQGTQVDSIHAATEMSHDRAKAGLDQVKQAAVYQNSCLIS
mmetsp:Transcript_16975/g.24597  ORF Transcript_16975/g.24597 Transcript_16975/m.24597 type:complete len:173 (+) Transcript_16975:305-823(+)